MFEPLVTSSLSSQFESDDFDVLRHVLFHPRLWSTGREVAALEEEIASYIGMPRAFAFFSGRGALYAILSALHLPPDAEVLVPGFTCIAAVAPVLWVGAQPVYVDIDERTLNMSPVDLARKITQKSRVVIVQHTFGLACELESLLAFARRHNLFIIEDCAHALGTEYAGKKVGSFGDASFLSFGRDKVISGIFGGMALMRDRVYSDRMTHFSSQLIFPPRRLLFKILLQPFLTSLARRRYHIFSSGKIFLKTLKTLRFLNFAVEKIEKRGGRPSFLSFRLPNALAIIVRHQFSKLDDLQTHRTWVAGRFQKTFTAFGQENMPMNVSSDGKGNHIFLRWVLRHPTATHVLRRAEQHNVFIGDWHGSPLVPSGVSYTAFHFNPATCPIACRAAKEIIPFPTHPQIGEKEIERLACLFKNYAFPAK
ncbi:MAG: hypothetical protein A3B74_03930 [Candidatus Kerfeldbacteria bacterium RIFCSPHIGHO2_02_FULL_42_14]|uniref:DegT/DnrJ/EryC1/StrS aminotransferase n=1 Tax=Candidatus Kerfeldbacteria bacterium RIFCSPHIGHO2_02_FULL_42_14 TaxID=1798540 RepID=A0A1G2ASN4_9BACT|nr:MAG: hypothetical protein A3B74_03930 [Candidatus Kerfeldbacteria bacterium RIFCSPHIGHO2_02_FULL_42_14]OGY82586.1 MAG: hypothetical protein A3I91_04090 [Candidatus Kerfeldbacteria bacterium RIFCSPLOWO2_02_FULL_42_19]OGY85189.1 MAG: hypothetical protein A3G01_01220 [Candidatus Kerfeldbacteria bacterium RIFCSPLOWO2_12_FULL_43_9]